MSTNIIKNVQRKLSLTVDGEAGSKTWAAIDHAIPEPTPALQPNEKTPSGKKVLKGDGTWPFIAYVDGDDIRCDNIIITCFGGDGVEDDDPQDKGATASGVNTATQKIDGVSIAMDSKLFPGMKDHDPFGYKALLGSPFPRIPWGTMVEVTIGATVYKPANGIVDLGPGKRATKDPQHPHALDLTPIAAQHFQPKSSTEVLAKTFDGRGSFRIIGGAKFLK